MSEATAMPQPRGSPTRTIFPPGSSAASAWAAASWACPRPISEDLRRSFVDRRFICGLAASQTLPLEVAPVLGADGFTTVAVSGRCTGLDVFLGRSHLPFANVINTILEWHRRPRLIANADRILARAAAPTAAHGARFALIFLLQPGECLNRAYAFDPAGLEQPYRSLLPACPTEPAAIHQLQLPADGHWIPAGQRWTAQALLDLMGEPDGKGTVAAGTRARP